MHKQNSVILQVADKTYIYVECTVRKLHYKLRLKSYLIFSCIIHKEKDGVKFFLGQLVPPM